MCPVRRIPYNIRYTGAEDPSTLDEEAEIMTTTRPKVQHVLQSLTTCRSCGIPMTETEPETGSPARYVCPNRTAQGPVGCLTPLVDAESLDRLVIAKLLDRVLTENTLQDVVSLVKRGTGEEAAKGRQRLEAAEDELSELNLRRGNIVGAVEHGAATYQDAERRLEEMNQAQMELQAQAQEARESLAEAEHASGSDDRIRAYALDLNTYLRESNADIAKEFLGAFIPGGAGRRWFRRHQVHGVHLTGGRSRHRRGHARVGLDCRISIQRKAGPIVTRHNPPDTALQGHVSQAGLHPV